MIGIIGISLVGVAAGLTCGLARLKAWWLMLITVVFSMSTLIDGEVAGIGAGAGTITLRLFIGAAFLQLFYFIGWFLFDERKLAATSPKPQALAARHYSGTAISNRPRTENELPFAS